jgi:AhpD family alkylhydroperoxidase
MMARIEGVTARRAGVRVRTVYWFARRALGRVTGHQPERMIEPLEMYARLPGLLRGYARLEQATAALRDLDDRHKALAELKAATLTHCEFCIDLGSQIARRWGLTDDQLLALPNYATSTLFTDLDKLVLDYAVGMTRTPVDVSDDLFAQLRGHFDEAQLVELTHVIALENMRGRFNLALDIGAAGFSDGHVCAIPAPTPSGPGSYPPPASSRPRIDPLEPPPSPRPAASNTVETVHRDSETTTAMAILDGTSATYRRRAVVYWITTAVVAAEAAVGGTMDVLRLPPFFTIMTQLGYPDYFSDILGVAKLLGAVAILAPRTPRLKEWAYAGIVINMTGAAASQLATGEGLGSLIAPLSFAALAVVSWACRPSERRSGP